MSIALDTSSIHFVKNRKKQGSRVDASVDGLAAIKKNRRDKNPKIRIKQIKV